MDFAIVKKVGRLRFLSLLPSYRTGTYIDRKDIQDILTVDRCEQLEIIAPEGGNVCIDGEIYPTAYIDTHTLAVVMEEFPEDAETIVVAQISNEGIELSRTEEYPAENVNK